MLERAILTSMNNSDLSPPHNCPIAPNFHPSLIPSRNTSSMSAPYNPESQTVSVKIKSSKSDAMENNVEQNGVKQRKEEAIRKAHEVAQAIEARKEVEQKLARKLREKLQKESQRSRNAENDKRERHKGRRLLSL